MGFNIKEDRNLTMLTDFYQLTMCNGYFNSELKETIGIFDMFFRKVPDKGGFAIAAGLEQLIEYLKNIKFSQEDIAYLREKQLFSEAFLSYLKTFTFTCDVWAVKEGTVIFPNEPIVTVRGNIIEAQFIETMVLLSINYQSLIATKANRIVRAAQNRGVFEFGSRRAQGYDGAILGARAAYIGGCSATACVMADCAYKIPVVGTMAHSWVQLFDSEILAFQTYAQHYPDDCVLLIDTYNVVNSGVPNAIKVFDSVLKPQNKRPKAVRIDSGDIAYLSKKVRIMLDKAGYEDVKIIASNSLDEFIIRDLLLQDAKVDLFGVGENLITSKSDPIFGGVYKLVAIQKGDVYTPKIKLSETMEKITTPHFKNLYRFYNKENGKAIADYITLKQEIVNTDALLTIFDPVCTWKTKTLVNFTAKCLLEPIFEKGVCVYECPSLEEIKTYCKQQVDSIWDEVKRFEYPHKYYVDLSQSLWDVKNKMLMEYQTKE
ncbi:MAG: nicotinate phosphoribosyltransferase [Oscillospiraceae bacterium]